MASTIPYMKFQDWAQKRIAVQAELEVGKSIYEQLPAELLDRTSERWVPTVDGQALREFTLREELKGRSLIVFLPGSNTPTCSKHLPLLESGAAQLNTLGIKTLIVAVNRTDDLYAWAKQFDPTHRLILIPDMDGEFTLAAGVGTWSVRLGLIANRVAVIIDEMGLVLDIIHEVNDEGKQFNGRCTRTGTDITKKVATLFTEREAKKAKI